MAKALKDVNTETPGIGHNAVLDQDEFMKHVSKIMRHRNGPLALAQAAVKAAKKVEKDLKSEAKKAGVRLVPLEAYLTLRQMESDSGASEIAQAYTQYFKWGELSEGEQGDLFAGIPDGDEKDKLRWNRRGFQDIRFGALDPEGFFNEETSEYESAAIMPNDPPSYVPKGRETDWLAGAAEADELNMQDFVEKHEAA